MSFLSRRVNQGPRGAWAKNTWFLQTSNWSFRLSSNPKKKKQKKQKNKAIREKKPSSHACYQGVYGFDLKGFEITPREKTLRRPFYSKCGLKSIKAAGTSTWTYLCKIFLPRITAWTERFKSDWRERQRDSIVRSQTHKRTLKHVFCKTTVF